ncbi:hypothetical protein BSZ39_09570 [Bowdeniella nasicola]|uniref:Rhodanese domain-containing protein n=1 Tax=Bowdeniella nasicola TaxID=208480 RepID=A0A1Q5Q126_9ACTO|nr:sulfurtransferase [Bowdeniella nasicola]OKL53429.1 hypothetical protein BSZ39_09570 [Bowdeniella nasicola]
MISPFVSWQWCRENFSSLDFADVRWHLDRGGDEEYAAGHVPGAAFIDLDHDLSEAGAPTDGRHPLPSPEHFARALSKAGIDGSRPVIAYDSEGGIFAARLVWMLRTIGVESALLDGGLSDVDIELATGHSTREPVTFEPRDWPASAIATVDDVLAATQDPDTILIDARPTPRYRGEDDVDARAGHIPSAKSVPCRAHVTDSGHLRDASELREAFASAGIDSEESTSVVSYCGSGVTGCHNILVMEQLGLPAPRLYPGSFSAWTADDSLPIEVGQDSNQNDRDNSH